MNSVIRGHKSPSVIMDKLYLGSINQADNLAILRTYGIKYILVAGNSLPTPYPNEFTYKKLDINDNPMENIEKYFEEVIE